MLCYVWHVCLSCPVFLTLKLDDINIQWKNKKSLCTVVCSKGYPDNFTKNVKIENLDKINLNELEFIFHAGTEKINDKVYAVGGRVLNFVSLSDSFNDAKKSVMKNIDNLNWSHGFYRKDIGYKVIK